MKLNRIVLSGGWGYGNVGDETILKYSVQDIRNTFPDTKIIVLSFCPENMINQFDEECYRSIHRIVNDKEGNTISLLKREVLCNQKELQLSELKDYCDFFDSNTLFVMGGGGYFNDMWEESFWSHICELKIAYESGARIAVVSQTIGPISKKTNKKIFERYIRYADFVSVRDKTSQNFLVNRFNISAQCYPDVVNRVGQEHRGKECCSIKKIAIMYQKLRPYTNIETSILQYRVQQFVNLILRKNYAFNKSFMDFIKFIQNEYPEMEIDFVLSTEWHINRVRRLIRKNRVNNVKVLHNFTAEGLVNAIAHYDFMLTANMHPAIIATSCGIPTIAISHTYKMDDFMDTIQQGDYCIRADRLTGETLINIFEKLDIKNSKSILLKESELLQKDLDLFYEDMKKCIEKL